MQSGKQNHISEKTVISWLIITTILWGGSFVVNKIAFREVPPLMFMFLRFLLATCIMGVSCVKRLAKFDLNILKKGIVVGLALAAANISFVIGVSSTSVSRAGFLNNLFVLFIPLLCFVFWRHYIDRWSITGVIIAFFGLMQLALFGPEGFNKGDFISTICALFIAGHIIAVSHLLKSEDVYLVTLVQFATVTVFSGIIICFMKFEPYHFGTISLASLTYCAIFPTVICFTIQNRFQRHITPTKAGLIYTLDPVWCLLGGYFILNEHLSFGEWVGCTFVFIAVAVPFLSRIWTEYQAKPTWE
jgi:drug/metabolite transporter (DMT)-like permease